MVVVEVRLFTFAADVTQEHAYVVGTTPGGLTDVLERFRVDERTCTFRKVRGVIEMGAADSKGRGERRSMLYREILFECERSPNPHCWAAQARRSSYRLGFLPPRAALPEGGLEHKGTAGAEDESGAATVPELVPLALEPEINLVGFLRQNARRETNADVVELVVVPLSQVGPGCERACRGCAMCAESRAPDSDRITTFFRDGRVQTVRANAVDSVGVALAAEDTYI